MNTDNQRVTMIMGAGAVLDMNFPCNIIKPTTMNITGSVSKSVSGEVPSDSSDMQI